MKKTNPKVEFFFKKDTPWQDAYGKLRKIALDCGLSEELKWGQPCYTNDGNNIVLIHGFKEYCAYLFFKGALMKDPKKILIQQTENVQSARQIRFKDSREITKQAAALKAYIENAIAVEKSGEKVAFKKTAEFKMPAEFKSRLGKDAALEKAFYALTPGRQRAYLLHFAGAKQSATREARIEKNIDRIMDGIGLND
jgi:uncharacterized protein YdeI (YjbR/CyaY-like superfamily)